MLHGVRTLEMSRDLASVVFGGPATQLVTRLRWVMVVVITLGAPTPTIVTFVMRWASGGVGQFALAYQWPLWLEVWYCVGWWLALGVVLLWYVSLQRELAWMALKQPSTLWIIAMSGLWVAGLASLSEFGIHRSTWITVPIYINCGLFFPLVAMADALPSAMRLSCLRFFGPTAVMAMGAVAIVLRLPTAEGTPGKLVWTVMGTDTVTNLQVITYSSTVIAVLLAEGVLRAWVFPNELAFIRAKLRVRVRGRGSDGAAVAPAVDEEPHFHVRVRVGPEAATPTLAAVARRSGSSVDPGQTESSPVHELQHADGTVEASSFLSAVSATARYGRALSSASEPCLLRFCVEHVPALYVHCMQVPVAPPTPAPDSNLAAPSTRAKRAADAPAVWHGLNGAKRLMAEFKEMRAEIEQAGALGAPCGPARLRNLEFHEDHLFCWRMEVSKGSAAPVSLQSRWYPRLAQHISSE